jgi:hypothetical protein
VRPDIGEEVGTGAEKPISFVDLMGGSDEEKFDDSTQKPIEMMRRADSEREKPPIQVRRQTGIDDARAISSAQSRASAQPSSGC